MSFTGPRIVAGRRPLVVCRLIGVAATQGPSYGAGTATLVLSGGAQARALKRATGAAAITVTTTGRSRAVRRAAGTAALTVAGAAAGRRAKRAAGLAALTIAASAAARIGLGADLIAGWDAERADLITTTADAISSCRDIVAGYDAVQASGAAQPLYLPTGFGGGAGIFGDGLDDCLTCTDVALLAALPSNANPGEIWVLCSQTALAADSTVRHVVDYGNGGLVSRRIRRTVVSGVNRASAQTGNGTTAIIAVDTAVDFSSRHVVRAQFTATDTIITVDGGAPVSIAAVPATTVSRLRLLAGSASSVSNPWQGGLGAVFFTKPLSNDKAASFLSELMPRRRL